MIRPRTQPELEAYKHSKQMWIKYCEEAKKAIQELIGLQEWYALKHGRMPKLLQDCFPDMEPITLLDLATALSVIQEARQLDFLRVPGDKSASKGAS